MKVLLLNTHDLFLHGLSSGFKSLNWTVNVDSSTNEDELKKELFDYEPDLLMSFGRPLQYTKYPHILNYLGKRSSQPGYKYIHWDTDGILGFYQDQLKIVLQGKPDITFTPCKEAYSLFLSKHIKADLMYFAVNPNYFNKKPFSTEYQGMITYIARVYDWLLKDNTLCKTKSIDTLVGGLLKNNIRIDIWGGADTGALYKRWVSQPTYSIFHGYCQYYNLAKIYTNSYMNLCTQNGSYHISQRTYDILGSYGVALSYNTPGLQDEFLPDKDLIVVSTPQEAVDKIHYYKSHPDEYTQIKEHGYNTVMSKCTYTHRLQTMLASLYNSK